MTNTAHHARPALRRAVALLFAAAALPATALAQETVTPPTVLVPTTPAPAPQPVTPPPVPAPVAQTPPAGESRTTIAPGVVEQAEQEARERAAARRAEASARPTRAVEAPQRAAPATAPAAAPDATPAEPTPAEPIAQTAPPLADPVAQTAPAPVEAAPSDGGTLWLILAALGGVAALIAGAMLLRRRRADEPYIAEEVAVAAPVEPIAERRMPDPVIARPVANPVAAAPAFIAPRHEPELGERIAPVAKVKPATPKRDAAKPTLENAALSDADPADVAAALGGAKPAGNRPQLELAIRPIRAGMSRRGASVGFELTVANAGGAPAQDVRIGAFMLGEHSAQQSEIERMLTNPPQGSSIDAETIAPGDGATLEAMLTMPRDKVDAIASDDDGFTPVLVADARYRLPDGREGRTAAAFRIGRSNGGMQLEPIAIQDDASMYVDVEAELVGVPAKV